MVISIMAKTQVQIPDELFHRAKRAAAAREWSFAEIVRRGLEYMIKTNPTPRPSPRKWRLPEAEAMGKPLAPKEKWTELSHSNRVPE